jgi:peptidoglycan/LPS O-acetylase OafA/YrhL
MLETLERGGRDPAIDLLRTVAIALIVNSHMDGFYPVPALATGGAIGNALFFALSGFGLASGAPGTTPGFASWYRRRVCRIYPALVLAVVLFIVLPGRAWAVWGLREWVEQLIWPTEYWFIGALMLFYALLYPLLRIARPWAYLVALVALVVPYLAWYQTALDLSRYTIEGVGYFKWIHYLQVMLFGAFLSGRKDLLAAGAGWRDGALLAVVIAGYYGLLLLVQSGRAGALQGVTHLLVYPMILLALRLACSPPVAHTVLALRGIRAAVTFVAVVTLELYLVQGAVRALPWVLSPPFPFNILACWATTLLAGYLLHRAAAALAHAVRCSP